MEYAALAAEQRLPWKTLEVVLAAARGFLEPVLRGEDCSAWDRARWCWTGGAATEPVSATS